MGEHSIRSHSGGAYYNVIRITQEEKKRIVEELAQRKGQIISIRLNIEELAQVELIRRALSVPNRSEAIRSAIRIAYGLLAGAPETHNGPVIIQNPIVNLNVASAQANADAKPQINVNIDLRGVAEIVERLYQLRQPLPPMQRRLVEELHRKLKGVN